MKHNELNTPPWHHQSDHESCFHLEVFTLMWWFWISPGPLCPRSAASLALRRCPLFGSWSRRRWWWCSCLQDTRAPSQSLSGRQSLQTRLYFCDLTISNNMNNHLISQIANNPKHQTRSSSKPSAEYVIYVLQRDAKYRLFGFWTAGWRIEAIWRRHFGLWEDCNENVSSFPTFD